MSQLQPQTNQKPLLRRQPPPTKQLHQIFGKPALIKGEDNKKYDELWTQFREALDPSDFIEEMYIRNAVDLEWEVRRNRQLKASLLFSSRDSGLSRLLHKLTTGNPANRDLVVRWMRGEASAAAEVDKILRAADFGRDEIYAEALAKNIDVFEKIDRMIAQAELRRNNQINEIARHKSAWREKLQALTNEPVDVAFQEAEMTDEASHGQASK